MKNDGYGNGDWYKNREDNLHGFCCANYVPVTMVIDMNGNKFRYKDGKLQEESVAVMLTDQICLGR